MDDSQCALVLFLALACSRRNASYLPLIHYLRRRTGKRRMMLNFLGIIEGFMLVRQIRRRLQNTKAPKIMWTLPRPQNWFKLILNNRAFDHWWKENFRISRQTFESVCQLLGPLIHRQNTRLREAIAVEERIAVSLWRLATGDCYRSCGLMFGLSKASAVYCTHEFVEELCNFKNDFITFPTSRADVAKKIEGFSQITETPNVVAAIDGSHIRIKKPSESGDDYVNRKKFCSFILQGVVDSSKMYLSVSTGYPGSMHDARVLRLTEFFRAAENEDILVEPTFDVNGTIIRPLIIGDSAYPLKNWLIRPFKDNGALNQHQKYYNKQLSTARIAVEHAFGETKGRWRILQKRIDDETERIPDTIVACCILHNICILNGDHYDADSDDDDDDDDSDDDANGPPSQAANDVLNAIVDYL